MTLTLLFIQDLISHTVTRDKIAVARAVYEIKLASSITGGEVLTRTDSGIWKEDLVSGAVRWNALTIEIVKYIKRR